MNDEEERMTSLRIKAMHSLMQCIFWRFHKIHQQKTKTPSYIMNLFNRFLLVTTIIVSLSVINFSHAKNEIKEENNWLTIIQNARNKVFTMLGIVKKGPADEIKNGIQPENNIDLKAQSHIQEGEEEEVSTTISLEKSQVRLAAARSLVMKGDIPQAIDELLEIIKDQPNNQECNSLLGALLLELKQYSIAEGFLYTAVQLSNWTDVSSVVNLAELLKKNGEIELAQKAIVKCREIIRSKDGTTNETLAVVGEALGDAFYLNKNYSTAAELYLEAALYRPASINTWVKASTMAFPVEGRDYTFAENVLLRGLQFFGNTSSTESTELIFQLGLLMHLTDRVANAVPLYEAVLRAQPAAYAAVSAMATAVHSLGEFGQALELYAVAEQHDSTNIVMLANYAILLCEQLGPEVEGAVAKGRTVLEKAETAFGDAAAINGDILRAKAACER